MSGLIEKPDYWLAELLNIRCPNCKLLTVREVLWRCPRCGYPKISKTKCPGCGKYTAHNAAGACTECGYSAVVAQSPVPVTRIEDASPNVIAKEQAIVTVPETKTEITTVVNVVKPVEAAPPPAPEPVKESVSELVASMAVDENKPESETPLPVEPAKKPIPLIAFPDEEISVYAEQLAESFVLDSVLATEKYGEKLLRVKGTVEKVNKDNKEIPSVILGGPESVVLQRVQCTFDAKYLPVLERMAIGQKIAVLGKYQSFDTNVMLIDCMPVG